MDHLTHTMEKAIEKLKKPIKGIDITFEGIDITVVMDDDFDHILNIYVGDQDLYPIFDAANHIQEIYNRIIQTQEDPFDFR